MNNLYYKIAIFTFAVATVFSTVNIVSSSNQSSLACAPCPLLDQNDFNIANVGHKIDVAVKSPMASTSWESTNSSTTTLLADAGYKGSYENKGLGYLDIKVYFDDQSCSCNIISGCSRSIRLYYDSSFK